jgi:hypothetical protein
MANHSCLCHRGGVGITETSHTVRNRLRNKKRKNKKNAVKRSAKGHTTNKYIHSTQTAKRILIEIEVRFEFDGF